MQEMVTFTVSLYYRQKKFVDNFFYIGMENYI